MTTQSQYRHVLVNRNNNNTTNQEKKTSGDFGMPHAWFKMVKSNHYSPR